MNRQFPPVILRRMAAGLVLVLFGAGCSGEVERPATAPVTGVVTLNGKPLEKATVTFIGEKAPRYGTGITDAEGKFTISTYSFQDGAIVGMHTVTVTKGEDEAAAGGGEMTLESADPTKLATSYEEALKTEMERKSVLPEKYASAETSPLKAEVTAEGPNEFVFQLVD